jgi:phosphoenolpyruvate carboxylase
MRKIPGTMATQHPDNAQAPYWDTSGKPFIGFHQEIEEAVHCFQDYGVGEYMWDWEGKHADAAVIDRLFSDYHDYFAKHQLGTDQFLTFRVPNIWEEKGYSLLQAMTVILTSEDFARDLGFKKRPLFEVILPMTEKAEQLTHMQLIFEKLAHFKSAEFTPEGVANTDYLEMIPLIESVESQQAVGKLLERYVELHKKHFGFQPDYIRPFLARSDPALVSGLLATVIANKLGLSRVHEFSQKTGIAMYPISGVGSLPFRGGLTPHTFEAYLKEHQGMRTVSIQSSFRYDYPLGVVKTAIKQLELLLPKTKALHIPAADQQKLEAVGAISERFYQDTLGGVAGDLRPFFEAVPKRRDRRQHIGLLAYGRKLGQHKMPRAITFTAGFYSIGVPPEFIGIGRSLQKMSEADLRAVQDYYLNLRSDLTRAGGFLNKQNLDVLAEQNTYWKAVQEDIAFAEQILDIKLGPKSRDELAHQKLSSDALLVRDNPDLLKHLIEQMAVLRKSLG